MSAIGEMSNTLDLILQAFRVFNGFDGPTCDDLWWRTDGEYAPVTLLVNCNDLFFWGTSDCEKLTQENIGLLVNTYAELKEIGKVPHVVGFEGDKPIIHETDAAGYTALLWCCRLRQMRPQKPYYEHIPKALHALFHACADDWKEGQ